MANLDEEDIIEDDSFRTVLSFSPEVQEAIDQVLDDCILFLVKMGVALRWICQHYLSKAGIAQSSRSGQYFRIDIS